MLVRIPTNATFSFEVRADRPTYAILKLESFQPGVTHFKTGIVYTGYLVGLSAFISYLTHYHQTESFEEMIRATLEALETRYKQLTKVPAGNGYMVY